MPGPSASAHQVLVYSGPGVSALSLSHTILTLSLILLPHYTVQPVSSSVLSTQPWEESCALLVVPGGRDLPFVEELERKTQVTKRIREWVREGGRYLGICAGAYFASEEVRFDDGGEHEVVGKRDLALFPGACSGPTYPGFAYAAESGSRAVSLDLDSTNGPKRLDHLYYNGGGHFVLPSPVPETLQVIARYLEPGTSKQDPAIAAILSRNGRGAALLCSVHFEYPLSDPPARDAINRLEVVPSKEDIDAADKARIQWAEELLQLLGLTPTRRHKDDQTRIISSTADEDPATLLHPTHPSPIFVLPNPGVEGLPDCFAAPAIAKKLVQGTGYQALRDANDELRISTVAALPEAESSSDGIARYLSIRRRTPPTLPLPVQALSVSDGPPEPPQPPDFHTIPKTLIMPDPNLPYTPRWTPLFNFDTYWSQLDTARRKAGGKSGVLRADLVEGGQRPLVGDLMWYAETVTSTQTMLDG